MNAAVPSKFVAGKKSFPRDHLEEMDDSEEDPLPWRKCVLGCFVDEDQEVIFVNCLHVICSDACLAKLKGQTKPGAALRCELCLIEIAPLELETKVILDEVFVKKTDYSKERIECENCVLQRSAVAYCEDCPACLCQPCKDLHPQVRSTQKHKIVDDWEEYRERQAAKWQERSMLCTVHCDQLTSHYCVTCKLKVCEKCFEKHPEHTIVKTEAEKQRLAATILSSRQFVEKCDRAISDIRLKRTEIVEKEWKSTMTQIDNEFTRMSSLLLKRCNDMKKDAKFRFTEQVANLNKKVGYVKHSRAHGERFISTLEDVANNRADVASINFLRCFRTTVDWFAETDKKFTQEYDRFVEKDWHFQLDKAANFQAQKYLQEYCQVEYTYHPPGTRVSLKTYSGLKKSGSLDDSSKLPRNSGSTVSAQSSSVNPVQSRRIAIKSTAAPQLSANKLKLDATRASLSKEETLRSGTRPRRGEVSGLSKPVRQFDLEEVETETEDNVGENGGAMDTTGGLESLSTTSELVGANDHTIGVGVAGSHDEGSKRARRVRKIPAPVVKRGESTFSPDAGRKPEDEKENAVTSGKATEPQLARGQQGLDSGPAKRQDDSTSAFENGRPETASPESVSSIMSDTSERGLGKRKVKKKSFPEFLNSEQSLRIMRRESARQMRSYVSNTKRSSSARAQQKDDAEKSQTETGNMEQNRDYESDGAITESGKSGNAGRRQTLRRKIVEKNSSPSMHPKKRGRPSKKPDAGDESGFEGAPLSSIEEPPEVSDYPLQGHGRMKITQIDENEDYCAICLDGGDEVIVCCDFCPKVFHLKCHIPALNEIPEGDDKWQCNYDTDKETVEKKIVECTEEGSENDELVEANKRHFLLACKFVMECYKIPHIPTMRWKFPSGYLELYGKVPFHLKYIRERLTLGDPTPFRSVQDMLYAFRQMFLQAFAFYTKDHAHRTDAVKCFENFVTLVNEYYPHYHYIFNDILVEKTENNILSSSPD